MASGASSLDSSTSGQSPHGFNNSDRSSASRDYDGLKQQYDKAVHEVQLLRRQNSEMTRRCDHTAKELEYYRGQHRAAMNQLEASAQESSTLRAKYGDLASEKQRIEREIQNLQQEVSGYRSQQQQQDTIVNEQPSTDPMNQHYIATLRKYDAVKDEYDSLRKRHDDLIASHSAAVNKLELAQEELNRTQKQYEEVMQERNAATRERNGLKQQCTAAIRQWDIALRERNEYREALAKVQQQHEDAIKEIDQAMTVRMKASKDLKRLTEERNAAMQEYSLIMSERDTVHKEMEKLSDDLTQAFKKNKTLEAENKDFMEEKKALSYQIETLKREIQSALHDRDKALKECNDLREKFGEFTAKDESSPGFMSRIEYNAYRERDILRKDQVEVSSSTRDMYGKSQKERMDNLDQANQELDKLRKQIDKLQAELQETTQEAEVSKRRRDWAFNERDKIVLERESIRTLCDRLRKERDRAVSDLAEALRDSDDIKKQRNEASKELKELKEKIEAQLEKESRMQQFHTIGHNHSHDSAIDADMQEWETEILDIDLSGLASDDDLGFDLVGGRDDPQYPNDSGIYVSSITKGSIIDGKLKINDCISRVNNLDCTNVSKRMVLETVRSSNGTANMVVKRRRVGARCLYTTQLHINMNFEHGLSLETGIYISKISPGSLSAKEGNLAVGDRVLSINNKTMDGLKSARDALVILEEPSDVITITTLKGMNVSSGGSTEDDRNFFVNSSKNPSSPLKDHIEQRHLKMVNSCSQTEDRRFSPAQTEEYVVDRRYLTSSYDQNNKSKSNIKEKSNSNTGAWEMIREKIHIVRGPRHAKREEKNHNCVTAQPPGVMDREQDDALAELDSVIDRYHGNIAKQKKKDKGIEQNGGTWPKVRGGPIIHQGTGTIFHPRKTKVRLPLTEVLSHPVNKYPAEIRSRINRSNDAPRPVSDFGSLVQFAKSGQFLNSRNSFSPTSFKEPSIEFERDGLGVSAPSDGSIDISVKSGNTEKDIVQYYLMKKGAKCPASDSESNMSPVESSSGSHTRGHHFPLCSPSTGLRSLPPYTFSPHPHTNSPARYPSPTHIPFTHSGDSIIPYYFEPPYSPPPQNYHTHSPSVEIHYPKSRSVPSTHTHSVYRTEDMLSSVASQPSHGYEGGTFPRKKEPRIRIPSNPSVTSAGKVSTGSIERTSERGSPMPPYYVEVLSPGIRENIRNSFPEYCWTHKPSPGQLRKVHIDKSVEPLGIQISCPKSGGVFVSSVSEHSIASQVGLQVGDQLLEVCGINLRSATYTLAANVLRQCGNSVTMLVQYSPEKYHETEGSPSTSDDESHSRSGSPTPCNSPKTSRKPMSLDPNHLRGSSAQSTLTRSQIAQAVSTLSRQNAAIRSSEESSKSVHEPRYLFIETKKCSRNLGISLVGGNAVGIFVHSVQVDSLAFNAGLRTGDQILEYCGTDLRQATAEEAAYELAKPADKVTMLASYNLERYNEVKDKPGDSFYIKALFDRTGDLTDDLQLKFHKDDVLYVDNTMFNGEPGHWRAWVVDEDGDKKQCGIIPSKYKVEEELLRRSTGDLESDSRRGTTSARRSFFRRKKHQRSSSGDSKQLASFSTINLGWYSDSDTLNEETPMSSYQRVERLDYPMSRPVLIIGPLSECVTEKLLQDFPDKFVRCPPQIMHCSQAAIEKGMSEKIFVDYRKKGSYFECTTVAAVKDICDKNSHCILDISLQSVERLHKHQIYPIVLLIKFKSTKQIKEVKDARYTMDKVSAKAAKEMYEHALKLESEYRHHISAVIQVTGVNIAYMCTQITRAVDQEQNKTLWVPCSNI